MIGRLILAARERRGLSQRELADLTNRVVSPAALSRIERSQRIPTYRTLFALSRALNVTFHIRSDGPRVTYHREES